MAEGFWRENHERAFREAKAALFESRKRTVIALLVWAVALALVWTFGDHDDVRSEVILSIGFTVALGLVFPGVYVWEFITLIPRRAQEAVDAAAKDLELATDNAALALQRRAIAAQEEHTAAIKAQTEQTRQYADPFFREVFLHDHSVGPPKIEIIGGQREPYQTMETFGADRRKTVVRIGVRNGGGQNLSNCTVQIEKTEPAPLHVRHYPIRLATPDFMLRHDDPEKLVEIAEYWSHVGLIRFSEPHGGGFSTSMYDLPKDQRYTITVRVKARERNRAAIFELWVDELDRLRLQYVADAE